MLRDRDETEMILYMFCNMWHEWWAFLELLCDIFLTKCTWFFICQIFILIKTGSGYKINTIYYFIHSYTNCCENKSNKIYYLSYFKITYIFICGTKPPGTKPPMGRKSRNLLVWNHPGRNLQWDDSTKPPSTKHPGIKPTSTVRNWNGSKPLIISNRFLPFKDWFLDDASGCQWKSASKWP